jgi:magnesium-transporting ATPase (P-type)
MGPEHTVMTTNSVSKLLTLNINHLFNFLLFANALSCCYLVILNYGYFLRTEDYKLFSVPQIFYMMVVPHEVRMFHTVCRTTSFLSTSWTTLSQPKFHTLLLRVSLITELQFRLGLWIISSFCFPSRTFIWIEGLFHTRCLSLYHNP